MSMETNTIMMVIKGLILIYDQTNTLSKKYKDIYRTIKRPESLLTDPIKPTHGCNKSSTEAN